MRVRRNGFSLVLDYERNIALALDRVDQDEASLVRLVWYKARAIVPKREVKITMIMLADTMDSELEKLAEDNPAAERWRK